MARTAFGRPLRSVASDAAISLGVAVFALAAIKTRPVGWALTLIGLAMAVLPAGQVSKLAEKGI